MAEAESPTALEKTAKVSTAQPRNFLLWATAGVVAFLLIGLFILWQSGYFNLPGQSVRILSREHFEPGKLPNYNSNPPTSGLHYAHKLAEWGVHYGPIDEMLQVANLEKGGVILTYRPKGSPVLPDVIRDQLEIFVRHLRGEPHYCKLILARSATLDKKIALTAWGRIDKLESYDEARILRFINAYISKGPEDAPCL